MTEYTYTSTWTKGMNTRPAHNVNNTPNGAVPYNTPVQGVELWIATSLDDEVKSGLANIGDKWMRLNSSTVQWVAVVHKGVVYGNVTVVDNTTPPDPTPTEPLFPESFTLVDPSGAKAEYTFVRIIE